MSLTHSHTHTLSSTTHFLKHQEDQFFNSQMGVNSSKHRRGGLCEKNVKVLKEKLRYIQEEVNEKPMYERVRVRDTNGSGSSGAIGKITYEKEMMAFAFKKAEWKQERKKLKEEVKVLRALVEEKEERIREMREEAEEVKEREKGGEQGVVEKKGAVFGKEWALLGAHDLILADQMRAERARRDETVEKWKQLYLAIKMELDDLIQRTHEDGLYWRAEEEDIAEELKKELKAKEETIKELKSSLASMEQEMFKRDREIDILRQSLRIMSSKKVFQPKNPPKKVVAKHVGKF